MKLAQLDEYRDRLRPQSAIPESASDTPKEGGPSGPPPGAPDRKRDAKRHNEQLKAFYGFMNSLGAAIIITALLAPAILGTRIANELDAPGWVLIGVFLHMVGQAALRFFYKSEE